MGKRAKETGASDSGQAKPQKPQRRLRSNRDLYNNLDIDMEEGEQATGARGTSLQWNIKTYLLIGLKYKVIRLAKMQALEKRRECFRMYARQVY